MKNIMIIANNDAWVYKLRKETISALISQGFNVSISSPKGEFTPLLIKMGCSFIESNLDRRGMNPIADLKLLFYYIRLIKSHSPNVVLAYTIKPNLYGSFAARWIKVPYINNITGLGSGFKKKSLLQYVLTMMYKLSLKKSHCVFFQNTEDLSILLKKGIVKNNYQLIPGSGVNLNDFSFLEFPAQEKPLTFVFVGRIMKDKGIDQYLQAAKIIKDKYTNVQFNVLGFIEKTQPQYRELIQRYNDEGYINYIGFQSDVRPYIEQAHCIIQPSHGGEGLSNVLLETAAMGRVLIASNIPGCRETIDVGKNGFLFEAGNTKDLVKKIKEFILLSYSSKKEMGIYSRKKIEKEFDRSLVVKAYLDKVNELFSQ
ncbi:glycosyltransferase family 4 protein [Paenibacillus typhae]|uniref:glycosyltransferase family 4 protein n=1 Tax=Paenibacillus typhae TaxID=1174501 RepID=UPI0021ADC3E0|nr:glycosyltransferase family 4 protein [Paenibacillus typhae]